MRLAPFDRVLDLLLPEGCAVCDARPDVLGALLCRACDAECPRPRRFQVEGCPVLSAFRYREPITQVIHRFKYQEQPELARRLARVLSERVSEFGELEPFMLVPVPLHPKRLAERGYNQSGLLARALGRRLARPSGPCLLERRTHTRRQVALSRSERELNLEAQIVARGRVPSAVVLVDDVFTTGVTTRACFEALRHAGAKPLAVVTVAVAE